MWMGRASAWLALIVAATLVHSLATAPVVGFDFSTVGPIAAATLLCLGAYRTLAAKSGGLRMLCGAWGIAAGLAWYAPSYNAPDFLPPLLATGAPVLICAIGLALTVLHKEKPQPPAAAI